MRRTITAIIFEIPQLTALLKEKYHNSFVLLNSLEQIKAQGSQQFDLTVLNDLATTGYARLNPEYKDKIISLLNSDNFSAKQVDNPIGGLTLTEYIFNDNEFESKEVTVTLEYSNDLQYSAYLNHELGHYLAEITHSGYVRQISCINETTAITGALLLRDEVSEYLTQTYGVKEGSLSLLAYLIKQIDLMQSSAFISEFEYSIFTDRENLTGADLAPLFAKVVGSYNLDIGNYTEEHKDFIIGSQWFTFAQTSIPFPTYFISYCVAVLNSIWLFQLDDSQQIPAYNKLITTKCPDEFSLREACAFFGLPYVLDDSMHDGLDDALCNMLLTPYNQYLNS